MSLTDINPEFAALIAANNIVVCYASTGAIRLPNGDTAFVKE